MPDNETPLGWVSYPDEGDESWYSEDSAGEGLEEWLASIELFGLPTYPTFTELPSAGSVASKGEQRQFAAVVADRTVYRSSGGSWVPWFGGGTEARPLPGTSHFESVSTDRLGINGPSSEATEEVVAQFRDTDETTVVDFDTGQLDGGHSLYRVLGEVAFHGASGSTPLNIRVNGDSSSNYRYNQISGGGVTQTAGAAQWVDTLYGGSGYFVGYLIRGDSTVDPSDASYPSITGAWGVGDVGQDHLHNGLLSQDYPTVDQLRFWTEQVAQAEMTVWGVDYR